MTKKLFNAIFVILIFGILSIGCINLNKDYVEADIKKYNAVVPDLIIYYRTLQDPLIRRIKFNTIETWGIRILEALKHEELQDLKFVPIPMPTE